MAALQETLACGASGTTLAQCGHRPAWGVPRGEAPVKAAPCAKTGALAGGLRPSGAFPTGQCTEGLHKATGK